MMPSNTVSPYDGKPTTTHGLDRNDISIFSIITKEITPGLAKFADWVSIVLVVCFLVVVITNFHPYQTPNEKMILGAVFYAVALLGYPIFRTFWRFYLKKETHIMMNAELFMVKRPRGWKKYNRTLEHSFYMIPHDKSKIEAEIIDHNIQQGNVTAAAHTMRCYSNAFHICLNYMGTRQDILTVMGHKEATAILARLTLCDETINAQIGMGDGVPLKPEDQWNNNTGDIT